MATKRPTVPRLLVSRKTAETVEGTRIQIAASTGREWSKTAIHDAIIAEGLAHMDGVMRRLRAERPEEGVTDE